MYYIYIYIYIYTVYIYMYIYIYILLLGLMVGYWDGCPPHWEVTSRIPWLVLRK